LTKCNLNDHILAIHSMRASLLEASLDLDALCYRSCYASPHS